MKKRKAVIVTAVVLLLSLAVAYIIYIVTKNNKAKEIKLPDIPVITFFGITGDTTTPADIIAVERDLNNVLMIDGYAVKLFLAPEDRYGTMIKSAKETMDAYKENNKKKGKEKYGFEYGFDYATSTFSYKCDKDSVTPSVVYNQDTIIELLDAGQDICPNTPSIDVLLVTNYDDYCRMAQNDEFERLNGALTDIAKSLYHSIPAPFFDAVKLNEGGDIFGVPCVQEVGEYEFMVCDKDLLDKYGVSEKQLLSVEDLDPYLKTVHADSESGVVPLLNAPLSSPLELSDGKSVGVVPSSGALEFPYANDDFIAYYGTISRYRSLGFMGGKYADILKDDFAVAFFRGTEAEVKELSEKTGKNLVYNVYSKPYATSREVCEAVFCVCAPRKYSLAKPEHGIDFICKLNAPKSQTDIKNILLYGALGINYGISDTDGYVDYAHGNTYKMSNLYTGHTLHAHPAHDNGVSPEWAESVKAHNLDLVSSKFAGFKYGQTPFSVEDAAGKPCKDENGETLKFEKPDYFALADKVAGRYYGNYAGGFTGAVGIEDFNSRVDDLIRSEIAEKVLKEFKDAKDEELFEDYGAEIRANEAWMKKKSKEAADSSLVDLKDKVKAVLTGEFTKMYNSLGVDDREEIDARLAKDLTEDLINERLAKDCTEQDIADAANEKLDMLISSEIAVRTADYKKTEEYTALLEAYKNSDEYRNTVGDRFDDERDAAYYKVLDDEIEEKLRAFAEELESNIDSAFERANKAFLRANKGKAPKKKLDEKLIHSFADFLGTADSGLRKQYYDIKGKPR